MLAVFRKELTEAVEQLRSTANLLEKPGGGAAEQALEPMAAAVDRCRVVLLAMADGGVSGAAEERAEVEAAWRQVRQRTRRVAALLQQMREYVAGVAGGPAERSGYTAEGMPSVAMLGSRWSLRG